MSEVFSVRTIDILIILMTLLILTVFYPEQQCMAKRFDGSQQALDLNNIRMDPGTYILRAFHTNVRCMKKIIFVL